MEAPGRRDGRVAGPAAPRSLTILPGLTRTSVMRTLWNPDDVAALQRRFATLTDDHRPRWGRMTCAQMIRHVAWGILMATGERPIPDMRTRLLKAFPIKQLVLYVLPFPRSAPTADDLGIDALRDVASVAEERLGHDAALASFLRMDRHAPWRPHPAFGAMTGASWGCMLHKHADHHLTQFGA